jgi:hypothetical protein
MRPAPGLITHQPSPTDDGNSPPQRPRRPAWFWIFIFALIGGGRPPRGAHIAVHSASSTSLPSTALDKLGALNLKIRTLCEDLSEAAGSFKQLGAAVSEVHTELRIPRLPTQFPDAEHYIYFILRALINVTVDQRIFTPFHPNISSTENDVYQEEYIHHMAVGMFKVCQAAGRA